MTLNNTKYFMLTAAFTALIGFDGASSANAQNTYQDSQVSQQQMNVSDTQLQEFSQVQNLIGQIQQQYMNSAQQIEDQNDLGALQQQTNQQMVQAIEQSDLSRQEYDMITQAINTNESLKNKYMEIIQR